MKRPSIELNDLADLISTEIDDWKNYEGQPTPYRVLECLALVITTKFAGSEGFNSKRFLERANIADRRLIVPEEGGKL